MFVGHYAVSLAASSVEPRVPLWSYVAAAQLVDIGWGALVLAGVEQVRVDPSLPGSVLDLYHMPYTHSLPAAVLWSVAAAALATRLLGLTRLGAVALGLVVFSHWLLDLIVHRPDLELWPGGPKLGLGFWNLPVAEMAFEMGLVALAAAIWAAARKARGEPTKPATAFLALLVALQVGFLLGPVPPSPAAIGLFALFIYLFTTAAAWLVDRHDRRAFA